MTLPEPTSGVLAMLVSQQPVVSGIKQMRGKSLFMAAAVWVVTETLRTRGFDSVAELFQYSEIF